MSKVTLTVHSIICSPHSVHLSECQSHNTIIMKHPQHVVFCGSRKQNDNLVQLNKLDQKQIKGLFITN